MDKKAKAEAKRTRKTRRKQGLDDPPLQSPDAEQESPEEAGGSEDED